MTKRIFLAGDSGAIGRRLAPLLLGNGWLVFGSTRSTDKAIQAFGWDSSWRLRP